MKRPLSRILAPQNGRRQAVADLGPWRHNLHLPDGTQTAPDHSLGDFPANRWRELAPHVPADLEGWSALDIGCDAGFYSFELARRGAQVTGIDSNLHALAQARWAAAEFGLEDRVEFRPVHLYDLARSEETYDLVLFMGAFQRLRDPLLGLDLVAAKVRRLMLFQTTMMPGNEVYEDTYNHDIHEREAMHEPGWPKMAFVERRSAGEPTCEWVANHAGVEAMLRSSGLRIVGRPVPDTYLCEPDPSNRSCVTTWNSGELRAAVAALERNGGTHQRRPAEETERRRNGGRRQDGADGNGKSNSPRQAR